LFAYAKVVNLLVNKAKELLKFVKRDRTIGEASIFVGMSKRLVWIVTVFIGLAMAMLIVVQAYWIKNAILVQYKQFDQLIYRSMLDIVRELEHREITHIVSRQLNRDVMDTVGLSHQDRGSTSFVTAQPEAIRKRQAEQWLRNRRVFVDRVISGMLSVSPNIEQRIKADDLEAVIDDIFSASGIDLPYEYAIIRWNNEVAFQSPDFNEIGKNTYRVQLFPDDVYANSNYLSIYFPDKKSFLLKSLGYLSFAAVVLTLTIVVSFSLTVFVMFRQKRLSEIRNDFVSNMTHELKTPISTISLASQMLGDKSIPAENKKTEQIARIIAEECRRLGNQVEKVLQTAVFDKGKLRLRMGEVNMHELISGVVENFSIQIRSRGGIITTQLNAKRNLLEADQVHITNLLSNLLDNAIKYCTRAPEITVATSDRHNTFQISVSDNGVGINRSDQKRIFERFYRIPTGNIHTVKGFGLGLSYVKMITEAHGGYIEVESEMYQGSTFTVYLPLKELEDHAEN
jgi:two-component system phosphate regulon sensor histidine kinase PhoR